MTRFSRWLRDHAFAACLIILGCSILPRIALAWHVNPPDWGSVFSDTPTYLAPTESLLDRGLFLNADGNPEVTRTPGYPLLLSVLLFVSRRNLHEALVIQAGLLSLGAGLLYLLARRTLPPPAAFLTGLLAAFSPWSISFAGLPLTDGLFSFLLIGIFLLIALSADTNRNSIALFYGCIAGLATALAILVRPIWPLALLSAFALVVQYRARKKHLLGVLVTLLIFSLGPMYVWRERNCREAQFAGLSDISSMTAWRYLASRVKSRLEGTSRWALADAAMIEEGRWQLSVQGKDDERWRRVSDLLRKHPLLGIVCFSQSVIEHVIHPSPDILAPGHINFRGDVVVLAIFWAALLIAATVGVACLFSPWCRRDAIDRGALLWILVVCGALTASSGLSFGGGYRLRAPLEIPVFLLAALGVTTILERLHRWGPGTEGRGDRADPRSAGHPERRLPSAAKPNGRLSPSMDGSSGP